MSRIARLLATVLSGGGYPHLLRDDFLATLADGAVNGTAATPGPGTRATIQAGGATVAITAPGTLRMVGAANNTDRITHTAFNRAVGMAVGFKFTLADNDTASASRRVGVDPDHYLLITDPLTAGKAVGPAQGDGAYFAVIVLRAAGADFYIKGGTYAAYTLIDRVSVGSTTALTPTGRIFQSARNLYLNTARRAALAWLAAPLVSDGFGDTFGITDGLGHAEGVAGGIGVGGSGLTYAQVGTWTNTAGAAACGTLDGGLGIATVDSGKVDVIHEAAVTRASDTVGVIVRWTDANNYVYANQLDDGAAKVTLRKVVGGVDSEVLAPTAITASAGRLLRVQALATKFRVFYNNTLVGSEQTISDAALQTGTGVGLRTTGATNTFDALQALAMTNTEYDNKFSAFFTV